MKVGDEVKIVNDKSLFYGMSGVVVRMDGLDAYVDIGSEYMEGVIVDIKELEEYGE